MSLMSYTGPLYGKIGRRYVMLTVSAEQVDKALDDLLVLQNSVRALRDAPTQDDKDDITVNLIALLPENQPCQDTRSEKASG